VGLIWGSPYLWRSFTLIRLRLTSFSMIKLKMKSQSYWEIRMWRLLNRRNMMIFIRKGEVPLLLKIKIRISKP
jgi:hypothetical protein